MSEFDPLEASRTFIPDSHTDTLGAETDRPGGYASALLMAGARKAADLHGGRLDLATFDRGCRFTLVIPGTA